MVEVEVAHIIMVALLLQEPMVALVAVAQIMQLPVERHHHRVRVITVDKVEQG
jgi:hypothetical protein